MGSRRKTEESLLRSMDVPQNLRLALGQLLQAYDYARELGISVWDLAVEVETLRAAGLTNADLRWLACMDYIDHADESSPGEGDRRCFRRTGSLTFAKKTCVILTEAGAQVAGEVMSCTETASSPLRQGRTAHQKVPCWDSAHRELRVGQRLVKRFRQPAASQETILAAFQEEGWPPHLDDPLPPLPGKDTRQRLHDTINNLNRHQKERLIRFIGDGRGRGLCWELLR